MKKTENCQFKLVGSCQMATAGSHRTAHCHMGVHPTYRRAHHMARRPRLMAERICRVACVARTTDGPFARDGRIHARFGELIASTNALQWALTGGNGPHICSNNITTPSPFPVSSRFRHIVNRKLGQNSFEIW